MSYKSTTSSQFHGDFKSFNSQISVCLYVLVHVNRSFVVYLALHDRQAQCLRTRSYQLWQMRLSSSARSMDGAPQGAALTLAVHSSAPFCSSNFCWGCRCQRACASGLILRWDCGKRGLFFRDGMHVMRFERHRPSHVVAAVFFTSEVRSALKKTRRRIKKKPEGQEGEEGTTLDLELEILKFMQHSGKPNAFPTKEELIEAGRSDLVQAVTEKGGWLTIGWDSHKASSSEVSTGNGHSALPRTPDGDIPSLELDMVRSSAAVVREDSFDSDVPSSSAIFNDSNKEEGEDLRKNYKKTQGANELDVVPRYKQRRALRERLNASASDADLQHARAEIVSIKESSEPFRGKDVPRQNAASPDSKSPQDFARNAGAPPFIKNESTQPKKSKASDQEGEGELNHEASHERWRRKRRKETDNSSVSSALDWIKDMVDRREQWILEARSKSPKRSSAAPRNNASSVALPKNTSSGTSPMSTASINIPSSEIMSRRPSSGILPEEPLSGKDAPKSFSTRICKLESKLLATRAALKSGQAALLKGEDQLLQVQRKTSEKLAKASDSLEFRETEIMQTRSELRRTRAQVTALQGRLALELSEARKGTEEKQMLLDKAEKALKMMRLVRIVWPNPASHVLLTGSFDGWTNKIPMERSGAGVFVTALQLYPGRYEIKFIVDGSWRVDPCRPITYADGIENNVLMVY